MIKTAVVILNWNGIGFLKMFLENTVSCTKDQDTIIYIADNGSTDGSVKWVEENFNSVVVMRLGKNNGFAGGYSIALERIEADYFVLLNSDIEVTRGWLSPLINFLEKNLSYASCQPKILSYSRKEYFEYAGAAGGFIDRSGYPLCRGRILNHVEKDEGQYNDPIDIFWSTGACMAVRSEVWKKCGGFDPDFFAHMEEIDLCWRFHSSGYKVAYVPDSAVFHVGGGALPYDSPFKTFLNFRNNLYLLYKNLPEKNLRRKLFERKVLDVIAALFFLSKGQFKSVNAVWKAHRDFYRNLKSLKEKRKLASSPLTVTNFPGLILNKNIVFEFYLKRHRTFSSLKTN
ncbi:MAG: glycosyltransferase family 2 protein [Bacteroidales bacterium]